MSIESAARFVEPFRITNGKKFRLADYPTDWLGGHDLSKDEGKALLAEGKVRLFDLQERLYATDCWSVLMILQAMDAAGAWSASGRQMNLLACRYDAVLRKHARFVTWRRQWSHIIECWQCPAADPLDFPSAIWSPTWCLQRPDPVRSTGHAGTEPERRLMLREALTEWQGKCSPGFPATTLGL